MASLTVTNTFAASDAITAAKVNANFDDVEAALTQLDTSNIAANAGIKSTQLQDRYGQHEIAAVLVPFSLGSDYGSPTEYTMPTTDTQILLEDVVMPSGKEWYLSEIQVYADSVNAGASGARPTIRVLKNGVLLAGAELTLLDSNNVPLKYRARNPTPTDSALTAFKDGDEIGYEIGYSGAGAAPTCRGVRVKLVFKSELIA